MEKNNSKSALPSKSRRSKGLSSAGSLTGKSSRTSTSSSMESCNDRSLRSASSSASNSVDKEIAKKFPPVMKKDTLMKYNDFRLRFDMEEMKLSDLEHLSDEYSFEEEEGDSQDEELQRLVEESQGDRRRIQESDAARAKEIEMNGALIPADDDDIDSEEEKEIMKEIKSEIQKQVREEMKSELEIYQAKMEALEREAGERPAGEGDAVAEAETEADLIDPKMKEALDKMRKLDKVLAKWIKKEKQVKRDRILLERRLRLEIEAMKSEGREHKDVANNAQKFLALELPPHHNAGIVLAEDGTEEPVFATQLNENEYLRTRDGNKTTKDKASQQQDPDSMSAGDGESSQGTRSVDGEKKHRRHGKDFIKRNKELAANADDIIAMTEEEKKRLDDLLKDVDNLPDEEEESENKSESSYNPSQVAIHCGEGFQPDTDDMRSLAGIDNRLKELMLPEDYESIASSPRADRTQPQQKLFTRVAVTSSMDFEQFGEKALLENKEQRDFNSRLKQIEEELKKFHNPEEFELETPILGEDELQDLLDQCVRSLSRSTVGSSTMGSSMSFADSESRSGTSADNRSIISVESTPRSPRSARQWLMENPPKLSQDVLQKLLAEAYCPISKQLSTLNEEEEETMEKEVEANGNMQSIAAETWKLISQEQSDMNLDMSTIQHEIDNILKEPTHSSLYNGATNDRLRDSFESQIPSLPEIDPTGTLVTQGLNNQKSGSRPSSTTSVKHQIEMIQNSLTESKIINQGYVHESLEILSIDGDSRSCTPRPPSSDKRQSSASSSRSRTATPVNKSGT